MNIEKIATEDLRRMKDQEGLILQGCGGDLNEWVDGINHLLTANGCPWAETQSQSYDSALSIIGDYVNITSVNEELLEGLDMCME